MTTLIVPLIGPDPDTPEWHQWRSTGIGASEAAGACGVSQYETPLHIYMRKTGLLPASDDNAAIRLGRKLEPVVISEFQDTIGIPVQQAPCPMMRHGEHSFVLATPDAILEGGDLLEAKTTTWRTAKQLGEEGSDFIPEGWLLQAQQQMAVTGTQLCHLAALIDGRTLRTFKVARNDQLIALVIAAEAELWQRIQDRCPPEPNWSHARTADLIREMHGLTTGKTIDLPAEVGDLWRQQAEMGTMIKELETRREILRAQVLHAMGDAAVGRIEWAEFELTRSAVKEQTITYTRKAYTTIRERKLKHVISTGNPEQQRLETAAANDQGVATVG